MEDYSKYDIKPDVLTAEQVGEMVPWFKGKEKLVNRLFKLLDVDDVNNIHRHNMATPGPQFCTGLLKDLDIKLRIDNEQVLDNLPEGAFITVSNHPFGALDGITLIHLIGSRRPKFKVMVNMVLNYISAMRPNFIAVDALASDDPKKKAVSMQGIKQAIMQIRSGQPLGFFPAGAVSKLNSHLQLEDREWQPSIIRLIDQLKVPVIPIFSTAATRGGSTFSASSAGSCARCGSRPRCSAARATRSTSRLATRSRSRSSRPTPTRSRSWAAFSSQKPMS